MSVTVNSLNGIADAIGDVVGSKNAKIPEKPSGKKVAKVAKVAEVAKVEDVDSDELKALQFACDSIKLMLAANPDSRRLRFALGHLVPAIAWFVKELESRSK